jgi:hypothetical protein
MIMTIESFNLLKEHQKIQMIFDADKISEKVDDEANYQLFKIDNFFIEAKTSLEGKFKRSFTFYTLKELPADYISEVLAIPIVTLNNQERANELRNRELATKRIIQSSSK